MKLFSAVALSLGALAAVPSVAETPDNQLIVAMSMANILTLDPAGITGRDSVLVLNNIYDTLVTLDPADKTQFIPRLATSWDISDDGMTITYSLREGAKFASGNPVTAHDAEWSFRRVLTLNLAQSSFLKTRGFTAENADQHFKALDDRTFQITLPKADDPRLIIMTLSESGHGSIIDSKLAMEHEQNGDLAAAWLKTNSAGSSAFNLREWRSNEHVLMDRNDEYWGEAPEMRRVMLRHLPESQSQRLQLERGDIDVGYSLLNADLRALDATDGISVETTPGAGFYYLAMSLKDERFADAKVREALRYLIDYEGINNAVMPFYGVAHQRPISTGATGLLPDPGYTLDVERAKTLLAEAGYADGMTVTLRALSEPPFLNIATAIQGTLQQGGITANIVSGTGEVIYGAMRERSFELIVGRGGGGQQPHPDSNLRTLAYNPDNSDEAGLTNYQSWRTSFYDERMNQMIVEALLERDAAKQEAGYHAIQNYYEEIVPAIMPFSEVVDTAAFRDDVEGLIVNPWLTRFETVSKNR